MVDVAGILREIEGEIEGKGLRRVMYGRERCSQTVGCFVRILGVYGEFIVGLEEGELLRIRRLLVGLLEGMSGWVRRYRMCWIDGRGFTTWEMVQRYVAMTEVALRERYRWIIG